MSDFITLTYAGGAMQVHLTDFGYDDLVTENLVGLINGDINTPVSIGAPPKGDNHVFSVTRLSRGERWNVKLYLDTYSGGIDCIATASPELADWDMQRIYDLIEIEMEMDHSLPMDEAIKTVREMFNSDDPPCMDDVLLEQFERAVQRIKTNHTW